MIGLYRTDEELAAEETPRIHEKELEISTWSMRPIKRLIIEKECLTEEITEGYVPAPLGDWATLLGKGFSGRAEYCARVTLPATKDAVLDLGKVACVAEVIWNGKNIGKRVMSPYRYEIPAFLLEEENELIVRVTNGAVNEFEATDAFDAYYPWQLGNYRKEESIFHLDSLDGGIYNAMEIFYE